MLLSRRAFVHGSAALALGGALPNRRGQLQIDTRSVWSRIGTQKPHAQLYLPIVDPDHIRTLALRAVDAARTAGADYADVRFTRTVTQDFDVTWIDKAVGGQVDDGEALAVGVRALVNGYWGFAASPYWTADEMEQLAREAVAQAKVNARGTPRHVEWPSLPAITGSWIMPGIDPFSISIEEKIDFMDSWRQAIVDVSTFGLVTTPSFPSRMGFKRQERTVASTEGVYITQTIYETFGNFGVKVRLTGHPQSDERSALATGFLPQGRGWDGLLDAKFKDQIPRLVEEAAAQLGLDGKPVEIGRYDVVFHAAVAGTLLNQTVGVATQLDRALGYEANAEGTSYLGPNPLALLGQYVVGSPLLNVTANRSHPGGVATVKWDDEGVIPDDFALVKDGVLVDYQTTREQAGWLAPWYAKHGLPVRSHGCAAAPSALAITRQHIPNLHLMPGRTTASFADLVADTPRGVAIMNGRVSTDFQAKNGEGRGVVREIVNGKLGAVLTNAGYFFEATDLWKHLVAVGGPDSVSYGSVTGVKGQPSQETIHTVAAVPIKVKNVGIINVASRA